MNNDINKIINQCFKFKSLNNAKLFCKDTNKPTCTIKGNDGYYWVTTIGDAQILLNNGFELLK